MLSSSITSPPVSIPIRASEPVLEKDVEQMLELLDRVDLLHELKSAKNPEEHGASLNAYDAFKKLSKGEAIVIECARAKDFKRGRVPESKDHWYRGRRVDRDISKTAHKLADKSLSVGESIVVDSLKDLMRATEAQFSKEARATYLTQEEKDMASILRGMEGGHHGTFVTVYDRDDYNYGYHFEAKPGHTDKQAGLYDPNRKEGGFLGFNSRRERLTAFEGMELLAHGKPIDIRGGDGEESTVGNFQDLIAYERLRKGSGA